MDDQVSKDESQEYSMADLNAGAIIFAQTISTLLPDGEGILIKAKGEIENYFGAKDDLLMVANIGGHVQVIPLKDVLDDVSDFEEGMIITIGEPGDENIEEDEQ